MKIAAVGLVSCIALVSGFHTMPYDRDHAPNADEFLVDPHEMKEMDADAPAARSNAAEFFGAPHNMKEMDDDRVAKMREIRREQLASMDKEEIVNLAVMLTETLALSSAITEKLGRHAHALAAQKYGTLKKIQEDSYEAYVDASARISDLAQTNDRLRDGYLNILTNPEYGTMQKAVFNFYLNRMVTGILTDPRYGFHYHRHLQVVAGTAAVAGLSTVVTTFLQTAGPEIAKAAITSAITGYIGRITNEYNAKRK